MRWLRYAAGLTSVGIASAALELIRTTVNGATAAQVLLLVLLLVARFCGTGPALVASMAASAGFLRYFVAPSGFAVGNPNDWAALIAFTIIAGVSGDRNGRNTCVCSWAS